VLLYDILLAISLGPIEAKLYELITPLMRSMLKVVSRSSGFKSGFSALRDTIPLVDAISKFGCFGVDIKAVLFSIGGISNEISLLSY